jgi:hypothetical protein
MDGSVTTSSGDWRFSRAIIGRVLRTIKERKKRTQLEVCFPYKCKLKIRPGSERTNNELEGSARKWMGKLPGLPECGAVVLDTASARYPS